MRSLNRVLIALAAVAAISGGVEACHHHRAAMQAIYIAPQPVFMPAPVMIYDAPAPVYYQAPAVQYAPAMQAAPVIEAAPIVEAAPLVESAPIVESAPMVEEPAVIDDAPVEVGVEEDVHMEAAPVEVAPVEAAPVEYAPSHVTPSVMNPVQELAPYFYSLEAPLTQQPYAPTPVAAPPVYQTMFVQPAPAIFVPAPAPTRSCLHGRCGH